MPFDPSTATPDDQTAAPKFDPGSAKPAFQFSDYALRQYAGKKDTSVVYMTPDQYLSLSPELTSDPKTDRKGASLKKSLDKGDEVEEIPSLNVSVGKEGAKVTDQDGRDRALFAKESGIDMIPVAIKRSGQGDITELEGMTGNKVKYDFKSVDLPKPPMTNDERFGHRFMDTLHGAAQLVAHIPSPTGLVGLDTPEMVRGKQGMIDRSDQVAQQREREYQQRTANAPTNMLSGLTGKNIDVPGIAGSVASTLPIAALNPAASGVATGLVQPVTSGDYWTTKTEQAALGMAGAKASEIGGNALARVVGPVARAAVTPEAQAARDAGYVLLPSMVSERAGPISNALAGWGGKIKSQQAASVKNQEVTNGLAAEALGLPKTTGLTEKVFKDVRDNAGKAYEAVATSIPVVQVDKEFENIVTGLGGQNSKAAAYFPNLMKNQGITDLRNDLQNVKTFPPDAALEIVKKLRADAKGNLKAPGDPGRHALGLAQREAADAIDSLVERNLTAYGKPDVVDAYRQARIQIAKSYDIEAATNKATGDVNAAGLAKLSNAGKPLTDQLKTIADTANSFPKAMQNPAKFGGDEAHSALDFFASAAAVAHGNPGVAAAIIGRPAARKILLSDKFQGILAPQTQSQPLTAGAGSNFLAQIAPMLPATRNYLANAIRRGSPYFAPAAGVAAQGAIGP